MSDINHYTDNNFNLYQAYSYTLLIQVAANSFSFAIIDQNQLLVSAQNCALSELAHPDKLADLLTATYKKVIIGLPANGLTLIPNILFKEEQVAGFARFLDVKNNEKVFAQKLDEVNAIVYKTNEALVSAIQNFGLQNVVYTAQGWIKVIAKNNPASNNLYLEIGNDTVQFLYFSGGLRFYNTFEFKDEDELAYFTSFVTTELNLKPQYITLVVSGDVNTGDGNLSRLADFYPKIEINQFKVLDLPGQIPSHTILALAALSLCGS
ncbi:DUF3822 family protein [Mucilaginibacter sp.]|uniref:DUF3822 family protein n=1 Tax=Mucilaginibacter sp. TaxID=1882438 RepID=UPI003D13551E